MPVTDVVLLAIGYALAGLTAWDVARGWLRRPSRYRVDTLIVIAILVAILLAGDRVAAAGSAHRVLGFIFALLFLAQPYFLLRLVQRFHPVPVALGSIAIAAAAGGALVLQRPLAGSETAAVAIYFIGMLGYSAWAFERESRRAAGVGAARLRLVAIGTAIHGAIAVLYLLEAAGLSLGSARPSLTRLLGVSLFACYYAGLVGPRRLRAAWARRALYTYFREATAIPPDAAAGRIAITLEHAAGECVASVARVVLLYGSSPLLVARATNVAEWSSLSVRPGDGLVARAIARKAPVEGRPAECEPEIAALAATAGARVQVVPISGAETMWGVLIIVQRHGSLFPHDDIDLLDVLCRHTAVMLDHARLIAEKRDMERRAMDDRLRQAQKMEALGQLAGGIAHDFNNLLTAALGYVGSIEADPRFNPAFDEALAGIRSIAGRAADLTGHLLAFSRQQVVQVKVVNLAEVVSDLLPMLDRVLETRIELSFAGVVTPLWILADPVQIEQVVLNLAVNARDAMPEGGRLTICATGAEVTEPRDFGGGLLRRGRYARLIVTDTGMGMDASTKARIFEPFFTTKAAGQGTGLGLSTVYGIVTQLGGRISVDTAPGCGATFDIYLPVTPDASAADPPEGRLMNGSETILVVDDHESVRRQLADWLSARGYTVVDAEDANDARVKFARLGQVDLLVTDVIMPGGTGLELLSALREARPNLPALFVSGYAVSALAQHALLPAGGEFLQKPLGEAEVLRRIRRLLDTRTAPDSARR